MKKQGVLFLSVLTAAVLLSSCSSKEKTEGSQNNASGTQDNAGTNMENAGSESNVDDGNISTSGVGYRMGLGVVSRLEAAQNAGTTDGSIQVDTIIAAVGLDAEDRIVSCRLDMVQNVVPISNTGSIGVPAQTEYSSKKELGDSYGMKGASGIGKEWYEQAEGFEKYVIGKTVKEIQGIPTDTSGYAADDTLTSSVTISISNFQAVIVKAVESAY